MTEPRKYFKRFEIKYQLGVDYRDKIIGLIDGFMSLDEHSVNEFGYEIRSLYFDSPFNHAYYQKSYGLEKRNKLRIRYYPDLKFSDGKEIVFIEIKRKNNDNVSKARIAVPMENALELINDNSKYARDFFEICSENDKKILEEIWYLVKRYHLKPVCMVSYQRQAFEDNVQTNFRLTFDTQIKVRKSNFDFHDGSGIAIIPKIITVMEMKFNNFIPNWAVGIVNINNCVQNKISKFAKGTKKARVISFC